ncbi:P1 family peptidase [Brevibacillus humidisoli]|uniref:DmpA family aminopeptidase n=1 Tax=Brevibacillus humidisoli TaxID=2895522 RepID=UPI001E44A985|nr:P1 family peptidase [Brevibacillus humidisoli]UFJ39474.1 P1 family peptidase [Brevibacillus humidisoli]
MRKRLRELGYQVGRYQPGNQNAIVDVAGVRVGHVTLNQDLPDGRAVRTGVTAILPHGGNLFREKVPAACHVINGFGKTTGLVQVEELGQIESPILFTNTLSVGAVLHGAVQYQLAQTPEIGTSAGTVNVIVGECNDAYLNDIRGLHVTPDHAIEAIRNASQTNLEEGAVGAGVGMSCLGYKGGVGTSSRRIDTGEQAYTVGGLVVSNFGRLADLNLWGWLSPLARDEQAEEPNRVGREQLRPQSNTSEEPLPDGSIMIALATDAPLDARQLKRLAKRAVFGLARTGSYAAHGSGDIVIAFSTARRIATQRADQSRQGEKDPQAGQREQVELLREDGETINRLFEMAAEVVHESILNSLCKAAATTGQSGRYREAFPYDLLDRMRFFGVEG